MSLIWSRKRYFHILPKSSASPWAEFWLFQSAPCRRVCLLIPLFRKRKKKKKRPQENPIWLKHSMGTKCFSCWEKHFLPSFVQAHSSTQAMGSGEVWDQQGRGHSWCPLWKTEKKKKRGLMNNSQLEEACQSLQTTTKCR